MAIWDLLIDFSFRAYKAVLKCKDADELYTLNMLAESEDLKSYYINDTGYGSVSMETLLYTDYPLDEADQMSINKTTAFCFGILNCCITIIKGFNRLFFAERDW